MPTATALPYSPVGHRDLPAPVKKALAGVDVTRYYKARRQEDGNFALERVDIFKACERENPFTGKVDNFDKDFLEAAVARFEERKNDPDGQYLPPVHVGHHGKGGVSEVFAGNIARMWVGDDRKGIPTLYADIENIPPAVFYEIATKRLPYRSVEINRPDVPDVSSLALLRTEVPYHKMPLLHVRMQHFGESSNGNGSHPPICFSDYLTPAVYADSKGRKRATATLAVVQSFDAPAAKFSEPTRAAQKFAGMAQQYADGDEDEEDDSDTRESRGGVGGSDDGLDSSLEQLLASLSPEDLASLLDADVDGQQGQQPAGVEGGAGMEGAMPSGVDAAGAAAPDEQPIDDLENDMGAADAILQSINTLAAAVKTQGEQISAGMASLAQGMGSTTAPTMPPVVNSNEPRETAVQFKERVEKDVKAANNGAVPTYIQALIDENQRLAQQSQKFGEDLGLVLEWIERQHQKQQFNDTRSKLYAKINEQADGVAEAGRGFSDEQIDKAANHVAQIVDRDLALAQQIDKDDEYRARIDQIMSSVPTHFGEYLSVITPAAVAGNGHKPPPAPSTTAAKATTSVNDALIDAKKFAAVHKFSDIYERDPQRFATVVNTAIQRFSERPGMYQSLGHRSAEAFAEAEVITKLKLAD